ncbi:MAG: hypothetical protein D3924_06515 [Candidatus Electrothrix sp. AR4]|nr:hypothetical protein [Candidatus Electrothrix sp. AR4]
MTLGLEALNSLKKGLERGSMRIGSVLNGVSDNDEHGLAAIQASFLSCIEQANKLAQQRAALFIELRGNNSPSDEARLNEEIHSLGLEISTQLRKYRLSSKKLLSVAKAVEEFNEKFSAVRVRAGRQALLAAKKEQNGDGGENASDFDEAERRINFDLAETIGVDCRTFTELF